MLAADARRTVDYWATVVEGDPDVDVTAIERMPLVFKAGAGLRIQAIFDALKRVVGQD